MMVTENINASSGFVLFQNGNNTNLFLPFSAVNEIIVKCEQAARAERAEQNAKEKKNDLMELEKVKNVAAASPFPPTRKIEPGPRDVEVFSESSIETLLDNYDAMDASTQRAAAKVYSCLTKDRGRHRTIPTIQSRDILSLTLEFENMLEPIKYLAGEIELMARLPCADFHLTPILLLGAPGIGKTAFASALAKIMRLPYCKLKGSEPGFCLTGSHSTWARAKPGMLLEQMSLYDSAAPLFLVDELDKNGGEQYPIENALLDLLEPENARHFKDELFQIEFDVSHAVWVLTANTTVGVSAPLLSRMAVFNIPDPGFAQRKRIIEVDFENLRRRTGVMVATESREVSRLANRLDLDLRQISKIVRNSFITAIGHGKRIATFDIPRVVKPAMGFF